MTIDEAEKIKTVVENKDYITQLVNTVAKTMIEAFENLKIEDVNMFQLGYNKGYADGSLSVTSEIRNKVIDECLGVLYRNGGKIISIRFYEEIFKEMEQLKEGGVNETNH